jgi:hypothetical protein
MTMYAVHPHLSGKASCHVCWNDAEHDSSMYQELLSLRHRDELVAAFSKDRYLEQQRTAPLPKHHHRHAA